MGCLCLCGGCLVIFWCVVWLITIFLCLFVLLFYCTIVTGWFLWCFFFYLVSSLPCWGVAVGLWLGCTPGLVVFFLPSVLGFLVWFINYSGGGCLCGCLCGGLFFVFYFFCFLQIQPEKFALVNSCRWFLCCRVRSWFFFVFVIMVCLVLVVCSSEYPAILTMENIYNSGRVLWLMSFHPHHSLLE